MRADSSMPITQIAVITAIQMHADERHGEGRVGRALPVDEQEPVEAGDLRQVRHHDDVGDDDRPAADPAGPRAHRPRHPRERRPAVRVGAVHVVVGRRDEEHRQERQDQDRGRLHADGGDHEREHRGERIARRGRRDPDHDARHEAERVRLQALALHLASRHGANLYRTGRRLSMLDYGDCAFCRVRLRCEAEPDIRLERVTKRFGDMTAVDALDLEMPRGAFYALLGPSGCGKTTTLRMVGGFEDPTDGRVFLGGDDVTEHPPYKRDVNTVFQSYALFPHLSVERNVALRARAAQGRPRRGPHARRRGARPRPARRASASASPASSPAARRSASRSPARSSTARARCCSTSRSARSTCACASSCRSSSSASSRTSASPSCTSRTTRRRP